MTFTRMKNPEDRRAQLVEAATVLAVESGYRNITREMIATKAKCSTGLVTARFGTMAQLRRAIMRHAIHQKILPVIAQGLVANDTHAKKAPDDLKRKALAAAAG